MAQVIVRENESLESALKRFKRSCGICRQFLYEFSPDMEVITGSDEDHLEKYTLRELLPKGFKL